MFADRGAAGLTGKLSRFFLGQERLEIGYTRRVFRKGMAREAVQANLIDVNLGIRKRRDSLRMAVRNVSTSDRTIWSRY